MPYGIHHFRIDHLGGKSKRFLERATINSPLKTVKWYVGARIPHGSPAQVLILVEISYLRATRQASVSPVRAIHAFRPAG